MDYLDIRTLLTSYVISLLICCSVMGLLWKHRTSPSAAKGLWFISYMLQLLAMLLITLRGVAPDLFSIVLSGILVGGAVLLMYIGLEIYVDRVSSRLPNYGLLMAFAGVHTYYTYVEPSLLARSIGYSLFLLLMFAQSAWLMLHRVPPAMRLGTLPVGSVMVAYGLLCLGRLGYYTVTPLNQDYLHAGTFDAGVILVHEVLILALTFSLVLMVNRRLRTQLEDDIAMRKASEEAVRRSESRLTRAELAGKTGHWELHLDSQTIVGSVGAAKVYGLEGERLDYAVVKNASLPQYRPQLDAAIANLVRHGDPYQVEFRIRAVDSGAIKDIRSMATYDPNTRTVFGILQDITEQKRAEGALRASEAQYRALFENSLDGVLLTQPSGRILAANPEATRIFGYSLEELLSLDQAALVDPADERMAKVLSERRQTGTFRSELTFVRKGGNRFPAEVTSQVFSGEGDHALATIVFRDITERKKTEQELVWLAQTDSLTGLKNRRQFMLLAEQELTRSVRYARPLSLLMMDLDHFKMVNDTHGHPTGDLVLQNLGALCRENFREVDVVGRLGGEEFAVILPETAPDQAIEVAERFRQLFADAPICLDHGLPMHCTVSIGVSHLADRVTNLDTLMNQADQALYEAKHQGRNRVCASAGSVRPPVPGAAAVCPAHPSS